MPRETLLMKVTCLEQKVAELKTAVDDRHTEHAIDLCASIGRAAQTVRTALKARARRARRAVEAELTFRGAEDERG